MVTCNPECVRCTCQEQFKPPSTSRTSLTTVQLRLIGRACFSTLLQIYCDASKGIAIAAAHTLATADFDYFAKYKK
eukprot:3901969-Amphidinium_carterae.1